MSCPSDAREDTGRSNWKPKKGWSEGVQRMVEHVHHPHTQTDRKLGFLVVKTLGPSAEKHRKTSKQTKAGRADTSNLDS